MYGGMTVAQLKEEVARRGMDIPKGARKADLVRLLETQPVEVEAEVIGEAQEGLAIACDAGSIVANFDALESKVDSILADYEDWEPTADNAEDLAQCARERKYLNGLAKQLDERRKAVKNQYLAPLSEFESRANAIRDKIKAVSGRLKAVEDDADAFRRSELKNRLREHYEAYAGLLVDVVPYEKLHDERWTNKTFGISNAEGELEAKIDQIARDWEMLKSLDLEFYEDAEARFFDTLDVGGAIAWAGKLADDKRKIEAMKAEISAPMPLEPIPETPVDLKQSCIDDIAAMLQWCPLNKLENLRTALANSRIATGEARPRVMCIDAATDGQLDVIGKFCGLAGVTGVFKQGTLEEIMRGGINVGNI